MIREVETQEVIEAGNGLKKKASKIYCNSTDNKPTSDLVNGSRLIEVDTGKEYLFNEVSSSWVEVSGGGGGGTQNYKETYSGTALGHLGANIGANIEAFIEEHIGSYETNWHKFYEMLGSGDISMDIMWDFGQIVAGYEILTPFQMASDWTTSAIIRGGFGQFTTDPTDTQAGLDARILLEEPGVSLSHLVVYNNGAISDFMDYAGVIGYFLTLYFHEMPQA